MKTLSAYGLLTKIKKAINNPHGDTTSQVQTTGGDTGIFWCTWCSKKRYPRTVWLYALYKATQDPKIGFMLDKYQISLQIGACIITEIDFAGEIALITNYVE